MGGCLVGGQKCGNPNLTVLRHTIAKSMKDKFSDITTRACARGCEAGRNDNVLLKQALEYHRLGWSIIPIPYRRKAAHVKWSKYQQKRADENQLRKWFAKQNRNIAVVLGPVSGGLACRDFDTMAEYELWAKNHPELAKLLPTVKTAKGMHVYFKRAVHGIRRVPNGELRGAGGYCLLPPSVHPSGAIYEWLNLPLNGSLLEIDPELAGFAQNVTEQTEQTEKTEQSEQIEAMVGESTLEKAVAETLPREFGTRNRCVFEFARAVKSLPQFADADPRQLRDIVRLWHKRALPRIRTKEFEETWIDFLKAWPRIKYAKGQEPMTQIFEKAIQLDPPSIAVEKYPGNSKLTILTSLCRELQRAAGENPFFLSARTAGRLLNVSPMQASRWFFLLQSDGILKLVSKGGTTETVRQASRYRYVAS